jgi:hypothetical protein
MTIRDRIKELRRVRAAELRPHPRNWRTHPGFQRRALEGLLSEIGYADALLVRELPDGSLELIDGHLRAETTPQELVPVLVLDVTESEANKILATHDPLAALAGADASQLDQLLREVETDNNPLQSMLAELARSNGLYINEDSPAAEDETDRLRERYQVLIDCRNEEEQAVLLTRLDQEGYRCRALIA